MLIPDLATRAMEQVIPPPFCGQQWGGSSYDRRKFRSQTSDNMERWKAEQGRGREKRKIRRKKSRRERVRRKKMQMRERVGKSRNIVFFQWFGAPDSGGSKSRLAKAAGAKPAGQMRDEKLHAVVARSTFPSQNVQSTPLSDHFWKLRCRKSGCRCGAKHILKSKCTKHTSFGPLLEVQMSKKCTPLWGEAHFQVKRYKALKLRCRKSAFRCGAKHISKSKCTKHHMFAPLLEVRMLKKCTPLWREAHFEVKMHKTPHVRATFGGSDVASLHYTTRLHYTTLHYTTLHYTTFQYTTLH